MESQTLSQTALIVSIVSTVIGLIAHFRLKSKCCGRESSIDIDVSKSPLLKINTPQQNGTPN